MASMMPDKDRQSLMEFPCRFPIKVMGRAETDFDALVFGIIKRHVDDIHEGAIRTRGSRNGNFIAVTVTIDAHSREQLDNIYMDLTAHEKILMAL
jgi:hypothetical protein